LGGYQGRPLREGDLVKVGSKGESPSGLEGRKAAPVLLRQFGKTFAIRVVRGLEDFLFTPESVEIFFSSEWKVSPKANRMGVRYRGPRLSFKPRSQAVAHEAGSDPSNILDDCIPTGGIQVVAGVEPIVLCVDGPSTGGYAKIGTVISSDISWIGQSKPGDSTFFKEVSLDEAYRILKEEEALFHEGLVIT
jgi:allophanate hydrolase subunit 2